MRALALLAAIAALLASTRIQATTVENRAGSEIFNKAGIIAVVQIDSIRRAPSDSSVCETGGFEVRVRLHESWKGGGPKATLCSRIAWCLECRVLVAVAGKPYEGLILHGWPLERHPKGWIVRPSMHDPLLADLQPRPQRLNHCGAAPNRKCWELDLYHYFPLDQIKRWSQSRNPS